MDNFIVNSIPKEQTYEWLLKKHYAKRIPSIVYSFGLYRDNILEGVITYGIPPAENCMLSCGEDYKDKTLELNRVIKNDNLGKNVQSYFISQTFKLLPKPQVIISYADPNNGHYGYCYQSLNFLYTGEGGSDREMVFRNKQYTTRHIKDYWFKSWGLDYDSSKTINENFLNAGGEIIPMTKKKRYILFIGSKTQKKDMRKKLKWDVKPYPKGINRNYDTKYNTQTQCQLF